MGFIAVLSTSFVNLSIDAYKVAVSSPQIDSGLPTLTLPPTSVARATATTSSRSCRSTQRDFETGVVFPQWDPTGYGESDSKWLTELPEMRKQTTACWVEMPILFFQSSLTSTVITPRVSTPSVASFTYGIQFAHALGLHVFVTPLVRVDGSQSWAGAINFTSDVQEQAWFTNYWQALKPYAIAAARAGAEQIAIGTEEEWLQENAPTELWNGLIANMRGVFPGTLTYDMNWSSIEELPQSWMRNPDLNMIGVSSFFPLVDTPEHVDPRQIPSLWATRVKGPLDAFAIKLGEPVVLSEIGYRNSTDALYQPWVSTSSYPVDPEEQAAACGAVLANILSDQHIRGSFFWGWDDVEALSLKGSQAAQVIQRYYQSFQVEHR